MAFAVAPLLGGVSGTADVIAAGLPVTPVIAVAALLTACKPVGRAAWLAWPALALAAWLFGCELAGGFLMPDAVGPRMVVVTHNVAQANANPGRTAAALMESGADLLLLQEVNGRFRGELAMLRTRFPFGSRCRPRCSLAILSRWPLSRPRYRFRAESGKPYGPALVQALVQVPDVPVPVPIVTVHLSRSRSFAARAAERDALAAAIRRNGNTAPMILAGDFNLVPWSAGMRRLDDGLGPMRRATRMLFSYPARLSGRAFPVAVVPIDHLYAGPRWRAASVARLPRTGSDHYPVRVELVWHAE